MEKVKQDGCIKKLDNSLSEIKSIEHEIGGHFYWKDIDGAYLGCDVGFIDKILEVLPKNGSKIKSKKDLMGKNNYDIFPKEVADILKKNDNAVIKSGIEQVFVESYKNINNEIVIWLSKKIPFFDKGGKIIGLICSVFDITKQKKLEQKLEDTLNKLKFHTSDNKEELENQIYELRSVINEVPGNFYWKDLEGRYLGCNDSVVRAISDVLSKSGSDIKSQQDVIGKNNYDIFSKELADILTVNDDLVIKSGVEQVFVESHQNLNNKTTFWLSKKAPFFDQNGNIIGLIGSAHDITKQKELEQNLEDALKKSKAESKAKEAFIDSLSHDIRTPLTGIIGLVDVILKGTKNNSVLHENAIMLKNSTSSFLNFFNEILATVEDIDINSPENQETVVDLHNLLLEFKNIFQPSLYNKKLDFITHVDDNIPRYILSRKHIIVRIITNLLGNAIKFSKKGSITILIKQSVIPNNIEISVIDTGIGIAKKNIDKIFDRFSRVSSKNTRHTGSGLGLFMVAKYLEAINGTIDVSTKVGKGSEFKVTIPVKNITSTDNIKYNDADIIATKEEYNKCKSIPKRNILIIEDNDLAAYALSNLINEFNHNVEIADCGVQAVTLLKENTYDLIFLDQDLPDYNGLDLLSVIREMNSYTEIPILILSGHIGKSLQLKNDDLQCQGMYVKPMQRDQLIRVFNEFLLF
jgi:signal transduction histidine kinase